MRVADPTISLKQVLLNFEDILTDEQKRQYQASTVKPDAASVITFVAQIDAENSSTTRRCVAPRLRTFLDATQQFTGVVDTFVSSHPAIAALVWGGVKTTILVANNVTLFFDKVTNLIMTISKSSPTCQQLGELYPGCTGLQQALCDYYAIVVWLCINLGAVRSGSIFDFDNRDPKAREDRETVILTCRNTQQYTNCFVFFSRHFCLVDVCTPTSPFPFESPSPKQNKINPSDDDAVDVSGSLSRLRKNTATHRTALHRDILLLPLSMS